MWPQKGYPDVLLITYNCQRQLQRSPHLASNTSYPPHAPHVMIADHVQTGKSHHGQPVPTLTGNHFTATFLFHIGSQTGESNGETTRLKAGHSHAGAEQFQRSEEGNNRAPWRCYWTWGTKSPAPATPRIPYTFCPSFLYHGYLWNQIYFENRQMLRSHTVTPFKDGFYLELTAAGSVVHSSCFRQPHARLGHIIDSTFLEQ